MTVRTLKTDKNIIGKNGATCNDIAWHYKVFFRIKLSNTVGKG